MEAKKSAEEFALGRKSESTLKGKEAMLSPEPLIHENSVESEIICDSSEKLSQLDTLEKRLKINAGAMESVFSSPNQDQMIERGLQEEFEESEESEGY